MVVELPYLCGFSLFFRKIIPGYAILLFGVTSNPKKAKKIIPPY